MAESDQKRERKSPQFGLGIVVRVLMGLVIVPLFFWGLFSGSRWLRLDAGMALHRSGDRGLRGRVYSGGEKDPELARRRATFGEGTKRWDFVMRGVFGVTFLATLLVAAFDAGNG